MNQLPVYTSKEGDTVDVIAWRYYKSTDNKVVEQVLAANKGLADLGATLPAGVRIVLPKIEKPAETAGVSLWD